MLRHCEAEVRRRGMYHLRNQLSATTNIHMLFSANGLSDHGSITSENFETSGWIILAIGSKFKSWQELRSLYHTPPYSLALSPTSCLVFVMNSCTKSQASSPKGPICAA